MALVDLLSEACIRLDLGSSDKQEVLCELVSILDQAGKLTDKQAFLKAVQEREASGSTGLQHGVAIPHARADCVREAAVAFGIARNGIDFDSLDGEPAVFFMLIAEPLEAHSEHLEILATACHHLDDAEFRQQMLQARSAQQVLSLFGTTRQEQTPPPDPSPMRMVAAVTSCPVGISHTYLAAECLRDAARRMGINLRVETHGAVGVNGELSAEEIASADAVILAMDRKLDASRFRSKPVIESWVTEAIRDPEALLRRALSQAGEVATPPGNVPLGGRIGESLTDLYRHVMNGIAGILPFLIAGGVLISLAEFFAVAPSADANAAMPAVALWLMTLGGASGAFGLMTPVLAGFIGRSIALGPGFMPAMVGGYLLEQGGAGLLGGMLAGLLGGYGMLAIRNLLHWIPEAFEAIRTVLLYPLLGLLCCAGLSLLLVEPLAAVQQSLLLWLTGLEWSGRMLLGALLGALMVVDLGGPINKIAYSFTVVAIVMGNYLPAAAAMAAGMVPPVAMGLASLVFSSRFDAFERGQARLCLLKGICFVTEGVIPFAVQAPWRVIPACMAGAMLTGALSMLFGCGLRAPHGGVFVIPLVDHGLLYCVAIASGVLLSAILLGLLKQPAAFSTAE